MIKGLKDSFVFFKVVFWPLMPKVQFFLSLALIAAGIAAVYYNHTAYAFLLAFYGANIYAKCIEEPGIQLTNHHITSLRRKLAHAKSYSKKKKEAFKVNYPVGTRVITKANDSEPYKKGKIVGFDEYHDIPLVVYDGDPETYFCMGLIRYDEEQRNKALDKLNGIEQWNVLAENYILKGN